MTTMLASPTIAGVQLQGLTKSFKSPQGLVHAVRGIDSGMRRTTRRRRRHEAHSWSPPIGGSVRQLRQHFGSDQLEVVEVVQVEQLQIRARGADLCEAAERVDHLRRAAREVV